jgi:hypothetical protein
LGALAGCADAFVHDTVAPQLGLQLDDVRLSPDAPPMLADC